jgi:hypothetical protein
MTWRGQEVPCETIDISAGGLAIKRAVRLNPGNHRAVRIVPDDPSTDVMIGSLAVPAEVIDFSRRGAKLRLPFRLNVGAALTIGNRSQIMLCK